jgi:transposase
MTKSINRTAKMKRTEGTRWERVTTIGIDLSDRTSQCCAIDSAGEIAAEFRVATDAAALEQTFRGIGRKTIAIETGTHSPWVSRLLRSFGHDVIVANARKLRFVYSNRQKDDRIDARSLARVARLDRNLLAEIHHRSEHAQSGLEMVHARDVVVAMRTRVANHVRGVVKSFGKRLPACTPSALARRAPASVPAALLPALQPLLEIIDALSVQIRHFDRAIERLATVEYPHVARLRQICGVGAVTGLAYALTIDDPSRFRHSRSVGAWLGLVPAKDDSGERRPQMPITKEGDHFVRRLLVGSAQYMLGPLAPDSDLRRHGLAIAARGGKNAKKRAVVAVARKLAVLLHRLWVTDAVYDPLFNARRRDIAA